ncbi:hypothetical protein KI688_009031 [Linnemannia hyalina]|uniref:F-box domain-containing protein n=1 Tax=Linnemannia hyalina TaxID=64524 RepID=A0A9P7XY91_9FUNG|nr:hypothetical protein KI688_009031 [Linnemannia hyalina]
MSPPLSPLEIPEILEQIFSYVDESTIEQSVSRVNRTWFLLTRHRTNQDLVFNTNRRRGDFHTVMARLSEATRLWWHAACGRDRANQWKKLVKLLKVKDLRFRESKRRTTTLASASQHGLGAGAGTGTRTATGTGSAAGGEGQGDREYGYREHDLRRSSTYNDAVSWTMQERPLLELRLSGCLKLNLRFPSLLPYIQFLTVLKLSMWEENWFDTREDNGVDMRAVLTQCGSTLQVLHIRTLLTIRLDGPWIPKRFPTPSFVEPLPERWQDHAFAYQWNQGNGSSQEQESEPTNVLALRELVLERTSFYLNSLEALLCFTPHLNTLRLIELKLYSGMNPSPLGDGQRRLIAFLQDPQFPQGQILPLRSYTFSLASIIRVTSTAASIANVEQEIKHAQSELCQDANEWTFFTPGLSLPLLKFLEEEVQNVVTTLELRNNDLDGFSPAPVLHRYLCASPNLLHLRAEGTLYLVELLDIHGRMEMASSSITSQGGVATPRGRGTGATRARVEASNIPIGPPGIWACKNLQTLHIYFGSSSDIGPFSRATAEPSPVSRKISSRIVFGYLSRVCPRMHDLRIRATEHLRWATLIRLRPWESMNRRHFSLTLDSGFCLLTRLRHLEYLSVGSLGGYSEPCSSRNRGLESVDLDWMLEKKWCRGDEVRRSKERREARKMVVKERWETWLAEEEEVVLVQKVMDASWWIDRTRETVDRATFTTTAINSGNNNNNNNSNRPPIWGRTDPEIHEQLKDLGLLVDVKNMIDEMDIESDRDGQEGGGRREDGYKYWPMLRWMRMFRVTEYGRSREREVKRMLASVKEFKFKDKAW